MPGRIGGGDPGGGISGGYSASSSPTGKGGLFSEDMNNFRRSLSFLLLLYRRNTIDIHNILLDNG